MFPQYKSIPFRKLGQVFSCSIFIWLIACLSRSTTSAQAIADRTDQMQAINPRVAAPFEIDSQRVAAHGIRVLESQHLILFTDARQRPDVEQLPAVFDLAVDQWCRYFEIDSRRTQHWKMRAFIIDNRQRFEQAGLMPGVLPPFPAGYQFGRDMWVYLQPGDYYTRHLLLHEGTHAFMEWFLDGWGSPWYSEGMAEKLGLHHWSKPTEEAGRDAESQPQLKLNFEVTDKLQVPYWGRINLIKKDLDQQQAFSLSQAVTLPGAAFREVRHYGWAWAACQFLSQHALTKDSFAELNQHVSEGQAKFDARVALMLRPHLTTLERDWVLYIHELDYGLELSSLVLKTAETRNSDDPGQSFVIDSAHGWQLTSLQVKAGDRFQIRCRSKFQVGAAVQAEHDQPWIATADGITLEYYQGKPLGTLLAGVLNEGDTSTAGQVAGLLQPHAVGSGGLFEATTAGRLCLRINESPAKMRDNQGALEVVVEKVK